MTNQVLPHSILGEQDIYLFRAGKHFRMYEKLGSRIITLDGQEGAYFAVWAPNAKNVSVIGHFNSWKREAHPLNPRWDHSGIWEGFIPGIRKGEAYKYFILDYHGRGFDKGDPYAFFWETPPNTASIVWDLDYDWKDQEWMKKREEVEKYKTPMSVYEVHLGSWKKKLENEKLRHLSYGELADELLAYVKKMGFTHIELMPVMEHPYEPSWGYQITGYFAPTSRFGNPQDFMYFVDRFHQEGIGVILDWVPSHVPTDGHGLSYFDGTHLYEHADPRKGYHPDWTSYIFNYSRYEVRSFLISNALYWLRQYHADGLRVDAVASMIYLDYSREEGEWVPNQYGGNENLEALDFLREMNQTVHKEMPGVHTIAEESTAYPKISHPVKEGGLGFDQKWMMGWMHDSLEYFKNDPYFRKFNQNLITFSFSYAFSEKFMLPLSHDEVVHGKASLIGRMPGNEWQRFAHLRLLFAFMYLHPGTKLFFMGGEFGQTSEWNFKTQLDWHLLQYDFHKGIQLLVSTLNDLYKSHPALYEQQFSPEGFEWIAGDDVESSVVAFLRKGDEGTNPLVVICHFTPITREKYRIGVPEAGAYREVLNTDDKKFGGEGNTKSDKLNTEKEEWHGREHSLLLDLPPLSILAYEIEK
jgi:1,4-alpha-glucan branching enzyme